MCLYTSQYSQRQQLGVGKGREGEGREREGGGEGRGRGGEGEGGERGGGGEASQEYMNTIVPVNGLIKECTSCSVQCV